MVEAMRVLRLLTLFLVAATARAAGAPLAGQLLQEGQYRLAALEFRRCAHDSDAAEAARGHWFAAYSYFMNRDWGLAERQLDLSEDKSPLEMELPAVWLRARLAVEREDWPTAGFYFTNLAEAHETNELWRTYALRGRAVAELRQGHLTEAAETVSGLGALPMAALEKYRQKSVKRPWLGGLLGMFPGAGYAYSGEYGNALRALLLNSLFIWGMVETAQDNQWAVFSVLSFFELTWYSGSIYGGMDAAHRYNERALENAANDISRGLVPRPRPAVLPLVKLEFEW